MPAVVRVEHGESRLGQVILLALESASAGVHGGVDVAVVQDHEREWSFSPRDIEDAGDPKSITEVVDPVPRVGGIAHFHRFQRESCTA